MKNKTQIYGLIATVIAVVGGISYHLYNSSPEEIEITASLEAPVECKIGQLVVLDASMNKIDDITWDISPGTFNFRIIDDGRKAIFSSEKTENYTITVAIAYEDKVYLVVTKLMVKIENDPVKIENDPIKLIPNRITDILIENILPKNVLPIPDTLPIPDVDIAPWLPSGLNLNPSRVKKIIENLNILTNLIDKDRFETQDEIVQAAIWNIKRSTQEDGAWEPFTLNFLKYLENSTSKQDCAQKIKGVLAHLERIQSV